MRPQHVAVVGATGAVGQEMLRCLETRRFPVASLCALASERSAGTTVSFRGEKVTVARLTAQSFAGVDVALFSAGAARSREFAPAAVAAGAVVVDNSSAFRQDPAVPLVVPEINPARLSDHRGLIANPNCSTIIAAVALWPLHRRAGLRRVIAATYQAASGAGAAAMRELETQTRAVLAGEPARPAVFPHPIAFNLFCHDSAIDDTGFNLEERKMELELRKIFELPALAVCATCVRVPVPRAHCEALVIECERPLSVEEARVTLAQAPGLRLVDDRARNHFPMPNEASGHDDVLVGRLREDPSGPPGRALALFVAGDQLRKGAALNAVQIAELL